MSIIDELADCRRRAMCDVLDALGADGVFAWHSGSTSNALVREIWEHVSWLEERARWAALEDAAGRCETSDAPIPIHELSVRGIGGAVARQLAKEIRAMKPKVDE